VMCPFYRREEGRTIRCDGITDDSWVTLTFRSKRRKHQQMEIFCCRDYRKCELFRAAVERFEE